MVVSIQNNLQERPSNSCLEQKQESKCWILSEQIQRKVCVCVCVCVGCVCVCLCEAYIGEDALNIGEGFSDSSVGKEFTCNAGDPCSIPGLGRYPGEGIGYPLQYSWASLVSQLVKNLPAMRETWV